MKGESAVLTSELTTYSDDRIDITMAMKEFPPLLSHEEMKSNKIPLQWRDRCAALWIPLDKCRRETGYMPWHCKQLRHDYEECQYLDFKRRVKEMDELKAAKVASLEAAE